MNKILWMGLGVITGAFTGYVGINAWFMKKMGVERGLVKSVKMYSDELAQYEKDLVELEDLFGGELPEFIQGFDFEALFNGEADEPEPEMTPEEIAKNSMELRFLE